MKVAFIGDSVLDNFDWIEQPLSDVRQQLAELIPHGHIFNLAVDESKIEDIYRGIEPCARIRSARAVKYHHRYPYPVDHDGRVQSLNLVHQVCPHYLVLSVGSNEGQEHLSKFIWGADKFLKAVMKDGFIEKFTYLIKSLCQVTDETGQPAKKIIILPHKPHNTVFQHFRRQIGWGLQLIPIETVFKFSGKLDEVFHAFRRIYLQHAAQYNFAVIDLYMTVNPNDEAHYGSAPKELSNKSGDCLARLIKLVIDNHDFSQGSKVYYAPDCGHAYRREENPFARKK